MFVLASGLRQRVSVTPRKPKTFGFMSQLARR